MVAGGLKDQKSFCFLQSDINYDFLTTMPPFLVVAIGGLKDQILFDLVPEEDVHIHKRIILDGLGSNHLVATPSLFYFWWWLLVI